MDTFDYQRSSVPARLPSQRASSQTLQRYESGSSENVPSPISVRAVLRASRRYWWLILALWTVGSAGLGAVVYLKVRPVYRAMSLLKVDPTVIDLYGTSRGGEEPYMLTHVALITSVNVLSAAVHDDSIKNLPRIINAGDAIQELAKVISVTIRPGTYLIEVSMMSQSPEEAALIVNAVVEKFLEANRDWASGTSKIQIDRLTNYSKTLDEEIKSKADEFKRMVHDGRVERVIPITPMDPDKLNKGEEPVKGSIGWTVASYHAMLAAATDTKMQLLTAEADLSNAQNNLTEYERTADASSGKTQSTAQVAALLKNDPDLVRLRKEQQSLLQKAESIRKLARGNDPMEAKARAKLSTLSGDIASLLASKRTQYEAQVQSSPTGNNPAVEVARAEALVSNLLRRKASLEAELSTLKLENNKQQGDELEIRLIQEDHSALRNREKLVNNKLEQLRLDSADEERIKRISEARPEGRPISDKRVQYMAMAPIGVLGAVLGLVVLMEIRSGRVADTEVLASRMRHEVFSIAPLPNPRGGISIGNDSDKAEQRLARFVQSLDHLRVALCEGGTNGEGRCVMITSATGGEGKTTLSAHLAARCANAGTSTLLIDADMRRASLGRLLDVPPGMGLGDVLAGEADLDASLISVQAGGFHFLSAGTPGIDPTRVLKSTRLAELIGQLRQMYDLVILDTPPVLPVADALILGRWADGAVMAARYDASRLPLIERANRQIIAAGIPVLGVVVNGVKTQDQAYGSYAYSYSYPGRQDSANNAANDS